MPVATRASLTALRTGPLLLHISCSIVGSGDPHLERHGHGTIDIFQSRCMSRFMARGSKHAVEARSHFCFPQRGGEIYLAVILDLRGRSNALNLKICPKIPFALTREMLLVAAGCLLAGGFLPRLLPLSCNVLTSSGAQTFVDHGRLERNQAASPTALAYTYNDTAKVMTGPRRAFTELVRSPRE